MRGRERSGIHGFRSINSSRGHSAGMHTTARGMIGRISRSMMCSATETTPRGPRLLRKRNTI